MRAKHTHMLAKASKEEEEEKGIILFIILCMYTHVDAHAETTQRQPHTHKDDPLERRAPLPHTPQQKHAYTI